MKTINFVLPENYNKPVGGFKIVFQYANELVKRGYDVNITFLYNLLHFKKSRIKLKTVYFLKELTNKNGYSKKVDWFNLDNRIKINFNSIMDYEFPNSDYIIATSASTAYFVSDLPIKKGKKYYFIQNRETWEFPDDEEKLDNTYRLGMTNIVISKELAEIVEEKSKITPKYLPNFYDHTEFNLTVPIENRKNVVSLINHTQKTKRTKLGIEILKKVKEKVPDLQVELFGAYKPQEVLPDYFHFTFKASTNQLKNEIFGHSKVYLLPSTLEGWCLTGMEAMACGDVLVTSDIGGVRDYANSDNSILVNVENKQGYVDAIVRLLDDDSYRIWLAKNSNKDIKQYNVQKSTDILERILND